MKYIILTSLFFLTGCIATPVKHSFPKPPEIITERCPGLNQIAEDEEKLTEFLKVVTKNYTLYHDCASKHDLLVKWINEQREIHDAVFNKGN
jgi:hypothetical protein